MTPATADLQTRTTPSKTFKRTDMGYGWGRICDRPGCETELCHLNKQPTCEVCQKRLTNLEIVMYGNVLGVDWEGTSLDDVRAHLARWNLSPGQVRSVIGEEPEVPEA